MKDKRRWWPIRGIRMVALIMVVMLSGHVAAETPLPGKGSTVQPARATWTTGFFLEGLYSRALEHLGYTVKEPKKLANPIFYQALVDGDVDFWANGWFPLHKAQLPHNFDAKATLAGTVVKAGALQGYLVDKASAEKFSITSLSDFTRDEVKRAFDANDDGKADLVACPSGWGCEKVITHHLQAYDLEEHLNPIKASYSASMADALARYEAGESILFYTWTPNWTVNRLVPGQDVVWINVPAIAPAAGQQGFEDAMVQNGIAGAVTDPIKMGFPANDISVVANKAFLQKNPAIERLFAVMAIPLEDIAKQNNRMFAGENSQEEIEQHVTEWIALNANTWEKWLTQAQAVTR